jgi:polysaccharide export outer membrane protein
VFNKIVVCTVIFALHFSLIGCASTGTKTVQAEPEESPEKIQLNISEFALGVGDSLDILVWRNDDLKISTKINPSGKFMFPLIGEVQAAGKDLSAVRDDMKARLSKYLVDPQVSISVSAIQSRRVLVMGEVNTPGAFILDRDLAILDAVAMAGGWSHDAKLSNVILLRKVKGKVEAHSYDLSGTVDGSGVPENVLLQANDIVYVPLKTIANISRFMTYIGNILSPILMTEGGIVLWPQMLDALKGKSSTNLAIPTH